MHQLKKSISLAHIIYLLVLSSNVSLFSSCKDLPAINKKDSALYAQPSSSSFHDDIQILPKKSRGIAFEKINKEPTTSKKTIVVPKAPIAHPVPQRRNRIFDIYKHIHPKEHTLSLWTKNFDAQGKSEEKVDLVLTWYYYLFVVRKNQGVSHEIICERLERGTYPGATQQETLAFKALQANASGSQVTYDEIKTLVLSKRHLYS